MKALKFKISYSIIKLSFYFIGFVLTIFTILKFGLVSSHTPPLGFVIPVLIIVIGSFWLIIDWIISKIYNKIHIDFVSHYLGVLLYFVICILILLT